MKRPPLETKFEGSNLGEIQGNTIFYLILKDFDKKKGVDSYTKRAMKRVSESVRGLKIDFKGGKKRWISKS